MALKVESVAVQIGIMENSKFIYVVAVVLRWIGYSEYSFHKCKLNLLTAFELAFIASVKKKDTFTMELAKEFGG